MSKNRKPALIAVFILPVVLLFCSCPSNNKSSSSESLPSQVVTDFTLFESTSGQKLYRVNAVKAYIYEESQKINVTQPFIIFYNEDGSISSRLNALRGRVNTQTSDLFAQDSVVVITADSTILYTDSLVWNNHDLIVMTDAWVRIESKQGLIQGQGLISDAGLKKIEIKSSVTGQSKYEF